MSHTIKTILVENLDDCELLCYREDNCVSINIHNKDHGSGTHKCELNNSTHMEHDRDLKSNPVYYYRGAKVRNRDTIIFSIVIKVPLKLNSRYPFFLHFRTQLVLPKDLAKFQAITNIRTHVFWTFISENLRPPLIFLVPSLGWELE